MSAEDTPRQDRPEPEEQSPVITLPDDPEVRGRLWFKLREYDGRVGVFRHPQLRTRREWDADYKRKVLRALFENGEVTTFDLARAIEAQYGGVIREEFDNACAVIEHYCQTGGSDLPSVSQSLSELEDLGSDKAAEIRRQFEKFRSS